MSDRGTTSARTDGDVDLSLRRRGYCGRQDESHWRRCYRRPDHHGSCLFSDTFQLVHPRLGPTDTDDRAVGQAQASTSRPSAS
jgi:hypothetical protein